MSTQCSRSIAGRRAGYVAARLGSDARAGELLVSSVAWAAAGRAGVAERRGLTVEGREEPFEVVVLREDAAAVA